MKRCLQKKTVYTKIPENNNSGPCHSGSIGNGTVRITVFCSAIVIDVIVHCHTAGALLSQSAENNCPYHRVVGF